MSIAPVAPAYNQLPAPENKQQKASNNLLDKDAFLKLMLAQLTYQNPFNPQDSNTFLSQLAQITQLEQMINLNEGISNLLKTQVYTQAVTLISRQVKIKFPDQEEVIEGIVEKVVFQDNQASVVVNGKIYSLREVVEVK